MGKQGKITALEIISLTRNLGVRSGLVHLHKAWNTCPAAAARHCSLLVQPGNDAASKGNIPASQAGTPTPTPSMGTVFPAPARRKGMWKPLYSQMEMEMLQTKGVIGFLALSSVGCCPSSLCFSCSPHSATASQMSLWPVWCSDPSLADGEQVN